MPSIKQQLYDHCRSHVLERMEALQSAIASVRDDASNETKSSAGDKYETSREMMQQDIDLNIFQLAEIKKLKAALDLLDPTRQSVVIGPGSLAFTSQGNFYIAVSAGKLTLDQTTYFLISPNAPIAVQLIGKTADSRFSWNGRDYHIGKVL
jgi:transcription elongation GreA/GreB family factor